MGERHHAMGTAGGAIGFSVFSAALATCCGVPWAVALFGVTGAVALARLAFLLPYATFGAILLLAVAFWLVYRRQPVCSEGICDTTGRRPLRRIVWIAALLVAAFTTFSFIPLVGT